MWVAPQVLNQLKAKAAAAHPNECCGILLGSAERIDAILPAANVHPTPRTHFAIDPQALVDAHRAARSGGPRIAGYYHSHPDGPPRPSPTDEAEAARDGSVWAIVGADGEIAFWRVLEHGFVSLSYEVADA